MKNFMFQPAKTLVFLPGTLYFSTFYLKDLAKIFLLVRFEKILSHHKKSMVSGSVFHFLTRFLVKIKHKTVNSDHFLNHI